ncbi:MAG: phosphoribosylanthranilate isomerase, partial [Clostridiales bacterium]|nr:phosphoribosylanthranilate isomerase [Clostridiales bacterium]
MTDTKIKFCGLRREEDVKYAASLDAGFFGFILSDRFKRFVAPEKVARMKEFVPSSAKTVGVFVDETLNFVISTAKTAKLDMIQLHGSESETYIAEIKEKTGLPVIKMIKPVSENDIITARQSIA